ncbi:hypothetical protein Tco_0445730 [Tanacetum coccineum]
MSSRPKTLDFAIELASDLMDQKLRTYAEKKAENKRKLDNNNQAQQQLLKKQKCGFQSFCRHYKSDCLVLKNQGTKARGMVYALGGGETDQDINNMEDDINA